MGFGAFGAKRVLQPTELGAFGAKGVKSGAGQERRYRHVKKAVPTPQHAAMSGSTVAGERSGMPAPSKKP